jgi:predicted polyphosphate/ATP-dependent NAD kinase
VAEWRSDLESKAESEEIEERESCPQQVSTQKVYSAKWGVFQRWCKNTKVASKTTSVKDIQRFFSFSQKKSQTRYILISI